MSQDSPAAGSAAPRITLDNSRDLSIHLRSWSQAQVAFADAILTVAPHLDHDQLVEAIANLRDNAKREGTRYA